MTTEAPFQTLAEANEWFAAGKAEHGARGFTATAEYHAHYAAFRALFDADKLGPRRSQSRPPAVARRPVRQPARPLHSPRLTFR
jgi:hypothetical protein